MKKYLKKFLKNKMECVCRSSYITELKKQPAGKVDEGRERALCFEIGHESNEIRRTGGKMDKPLVLTILLQEEAANVELPESLPGSFHEIPRYADMLNCLLGDFSVEYEKK